MKAGVGGEHQETQDLEFAATVQAQHLRFRQVPRTEIRFSGTPDYKSSTVSWRRNISEPVSEDIDYHNVQVNYRLTNQLLDGSPAQKSQSTAAPDMSPPLDRP
jgi:hypothetical protein